jgi:hypothetical protein
MRKQLDAQHGTFVHVRPCYKAAVAEKKRTTADPQPIEVEQENNPPPSSFKIDVSQQINCRSGSPMLAQFTHAFSLFD